MSAEAQWTTDDPDTGARRYVRAARFAGAWTFQQRLHRRDDWADLPAPARADWEELLDALERRLPRREGVTDADLAAVRKVLARLAPPPQFDGEVV